MTPPHRVDLEPAPLSAGRLVPMPAYAQIASRIQAGSRALLAFGFYGPAPSVIPSEDRRRVRAALRSAAALQFELSPFAMESVVDTAFVNLIQTPGDGHVVVIACFDAAAAAALAVTRSTTPTNDVRYDNPD